MKKITFLIVLVSFNAFSAEWKANVGFNAIVNSGNSSSQSFGGDSAVSFKEDRNKIENTGSIAYGRARNNQTGVTSTNTKNWKTGLRYDRYLADPVSMFALGYAGQDQPAGFDWRYGGATGFAHEIWKTDPNFFKYEAGYNISREVRTLPPDATIHSARIFLQYKHKFGAGAQLGQDLETLVDVRNTKNTALSTLTSLTVKLTDKASLQAGYEVRFDNVPVPGFRKTDTKTILGIVVSLI